MKKRTKIKIKNFIRRTLATISAINLLLLAVLCEALTLDGWLLALVVDGLSLLYLIPYLYVNGHFTDTEPWYEQEKRRAISNESN